MIYCFDSTPLAWRRRARGRTGGGAEIETETLSASILMGTLPPLTGGVPAKAALLAGHLRSLGHRVTVAHYATLTDYPDLSPTTPGWLAGRRPAVAEGTCFGDFPCVSIGAAFPELEFTYYRATGAWRRLIETHDRHIAVGGTVLVSNPFVAAGVPHLTWCASTMIDDRIDRRRAMAWPRRLFDRGVVGPVQRAMERRILAGNGQFMAVSRYARDSLIAAGGRAGSFHLVPIPVDLERFAPPASPPSPGTVGFAGRVADPRKRVPLLFEAIALLVRRGLDVRLRLTSEPIPALAARAAALGVADRISWDGWQSEAALPGFFQSLDAFAIPSAHEGLALAGVQALASGVPVVSTRCGGPEDYVVSGETGFLVDDGAEALAEALAEVVSSRSLRAQLGARARALAERDYGTARFAAGLDAAWRAAWGDGPGTE